MKHEHPEERCIDPPTRPSCFIGASGDIHSLFPYTTSINELFGEPMRKFIGVDLDMALGGVTEHNLTDDEITKRLFKLLRRSVNIPIEKV